MILETGKIRTVGEALLWGERELSSAGVGNARMEALWMLSGSKPVSRTLSSFSVAFPEGDSNAYSARIRDRVKGRPLAYILGTQEFMGNHFFVDDSVLIPRPETEVLVRESFALAPKVPGSPVLEIGTGSGIVAVSLAKALVRVNLLAADVSETAIALALMNAVYHGLHDRITFVLSDLFQSVKGKFDMIVSNPPYVRGKDISELGKEIQHEPRRALDGGPDGLRVIEKLVSGTPAFLNPRGHLLIEMGYDQSENVLNLMAKNGFKNLRAAKDDLGIERVAIGRFS